MFNDLEILKLVHCTFDCETIPPNIYLDITNDNIKSVPKTRIVNKLKLYLCKFDTIPFDLSRIKVGHIEISSDFSISKWPSQLQTISLTTHNDVAPFPDGLQTIIYRECVNEVESIVRNESDKYPRSIKKIIFLSHTERNVLYPFWRKIDERNIQ